MVLLALLKATWFKTLQDKVSLRILYSGWTRVGTQPLLFHVPSASFFCEEADTDALRKEGDS